MLVWHLKGGAVLDRVCIGDHPEIRDQLLTRKYFEYKKTLLRLTLAKPKQVANARH